MKCIFISENDPESAEWKSFITMDSSIRIKPVLPYNHVINKEAENIVKNIMNVSIHINVNESRDD